MTGLWRGEITPRRTLVLARYLPNGAQTWVEMGVDTAWTVGEHLTASAVDQLAGANWQRGGGKGKQPEQIPRPEDARKEREKTARAVAKAAKFRARKGATSTAPAPPPTRPRARDARGRFVSTKEV